MYERIMNKLSIIEYKQDLIMQEGLGFTVDEQGKLVDLEEEDTKKPKAKDNEK